MRSGTCSRPRWLAETCPSRCKGCSHTQHDIRPDTPKMDLQWKALRACAAQGIAVTCLVGCLDDAEEDANAAAVRSDMDLSCKVPAGVAGNCRLQLVVATLDINQGGLFCGLRCSGMCF